MQALIRPGLLIAMLTFSLSGCTTPPGETGTITVNDERGAFVAPMDVHYFRPLNFKPAGPVLIVVHGMSRNADSYRDYFFEAAYKHGAMILTPEFNRKNYPGSRRFNLGNIENRSGAIVPSSRWSFPVIDRVFEQARAQFGFLQNKYYLFGHSAGSQFVHRMILFSPSDRMIAAIAANAGWYTLPDLAIEFPYGLKASPVEKRILRRAFGQNLTILLGTNDNDETHRSLRQTEEANAQGLHRLARGRYFFRRSKEIADRLGVPFRWRIKEVPGVGHSGRAMAGPASDILFGHLK